MIPRNALLCAALLATLAAPTALAQEFQISGGAEHLFDTEDNEFAFTGMTGKGSYFFNEHFGVEAEATLPMNGMDNYDGTPTNYALNSQFGAHFVGRKSVGASGEIFGRIGYRQGSLEATGTRSFTFNGTTFNLDGPINYEGASLGVGYSHFFNEKIGLRGEVTTSTSPLDDFLTPGGHLTGASISLVAKFGE